MDLENIKPNEIRALREAAGLSTVEAGELIYFKATYNGFGQYCRQWQKYEGGQARIKPALLELFILKAFNPNSNKALESAFSIAELIVKKAKEEADKT